MTNDQCLWTTDYFRIHFLHKPLHLDSRSNVRTFSDFLESIMSFHRKLDRGVADLEHFGACCNLRSYWRRSQMLYVDDDSYGDPALGQVLLYGCRSGVLEVINHNRCAVY